MGGVIIGDIGSQVGLDEDEDVDLLTEDGLPR